VLELGDAVAPLADQVMVMALPAQAITGLARAMGELVHDAVLAEERERPVDGGEAHRLATPPEPRVDLLRGGVVRLAREGVQDEQTLARAAHAGVHQALVGIGPRAHRRVRYRRHEIETHSHYSGTLLDSAPGRLRDVARHRARRRCRELLSPRTRGRADSRAWLHRREPDTSGRRAARPRGLARRRDGDPKRRPRPAPWPRLPAPARTGRGERRQRSPSPRYA